MLARRGHRGPKQMSLWTGEAEQAVIASPAAKHILAESIPPESNTRTSELQTGHQSSLLPGMKSAAALGEPLVLDYCSKHGRGVDAAGSYSQPCFAGCRYRSAAG